MSMIPLEEADGVEILIVLDNVIDMLMASTPRVQRCPLVWDAVTRPCLIAEHGFAAIVTVKSGDTSESLLFDAGLSRDGPTHNMDVLEIQPSRLHAIVLSHGHADHTNGLMGLLKRMGARKMPLLLHPDAFLERKLVFPNGQELNLPPPDRRVLSQEGAEFIEDRGASCLLGKLVLVTGQIERTVPFETGFPAHFARTVDGWQPDPMIHDDQALVVNLKDRGLVVLSGCGHAGIINTVRYAQQLTGIRRIHAVIGGFHLTGPRFEPIIAPTIAALKEINPAVLVPGHCTGWKAIHAIASELPQAYVANSVGTRFLL